MDENKWGWLWLPLVVGAILFFGYLSDHDKAELQKTCIQQGRVWDHGNCK